MHMMKGYKDSSEKELYHILSIYGVNTDKIRETKLSLEDLRDFVCCLDRLCKKSS